MSQPEMCQKNLAEYIQRNLGEEYSDHDTLVLLPVSALLMIARQIPTHETIEPIDSSSLIYSDGGPYPHRRGYSGYS